MDVMTQRPTVLPSFEAEVSRLAGVIGAPTRRLPPTFGQFDDGAGRTWCLTGRGFTLSLSNAGRN